MVATEAMSVRASSPTNHRSNHIDRTTLVLRYASLLESRLTLENLDEATGILMNAQEFDLASRFIEKSIAVDSEEPARRRLHVTCLLKAGRFAEAAAAAEGILIGAPDDDETRLQLCLALARSGEMQSVATQLRTIASPPPADGRGRGALWQELSLLMAEHVVASGAPMSLAPEAADLGCPVAAGYARDEQVIALLHILREQQSILDQLFRTGPV